MSSRPTSVASTLLAAAYAGVAAWLAGRSLGWPLVHDAPIMHYVAWRIGEGAVPYRDIFDMNFPGTYLLHLAALRLLGASDAGWRAFDLGWLAVTGVAMAAFARPWGRVAATGGALAFAVYHLANGAWQAGQRDYLLVLFLVLGALGVARWAEGAGHITIAWGGLALGAGLAIKPHALLFAGALAALIAVRGRRSAEGAARPVTIFVASVALVPVLVVAWVTAAGGLPAWREIVVGYLFPLYTKLGRPRSWTFHRWQVWIPLGAAVALSLVRALATRRVTVRLEVALIGLAYGVVHYLGQGKGWEYHLYPLVGFAGLVAFAGLAPSRSVAAGRPPARRLADAVALPLAATLAISLVMLAQKGAEAADAAWIDAKARLVRAVTEDLDPLAPGDTVQVLDTTEGGVHALLRLGVAQPTRFVYDFHFFHDEDTPVVRGLRAELMRGLAARPPRYIVLFRRGWPAGGLDRVTRFPELDRCLAATYRVRHGRGDYVVYEKRRDP